MIYALPRVVSGRFVYIGAGIAAAKGLAHPLKRFELELSPEMVRNQLYFAAIVEEASNYALEGRIVFALQGKTVLSIPYLLSSGGYGSTVANSVVRTDDLVVPQYVVRRQNQSDAWHLWQMGEHLVEDGLAAGLIYQDDASVVWLYHVTMAPLSLPGSFDRVSWEPENYYGTATGGTSFAAVILGVKQSPI